MLFCLGAFTVPLFSMPAIMITRFCVYLRSKLSKFLPDVLAEPARFYFWRFLRRLELVSCPINNMAFVRQWLKAPVQEEDEQGKKRIRRNKSGTPQGGVISPLLANIYLHWFDRLFHGKAGSSPMG